MVAVFGVGCAIALIWSAVRYQIVYRSLIDTFPPQFQDDLTSRYAFPVLVLEPSTPLPMQAEYIKAMWGSCVALLCLSLALFSAQEPAVGSVVLAGVFVAVHFAIKSWKTYRENCNRAARRENEGAHVQE